MSSAAALSYEPVSVVIPAYNEQAGVAAQVATIQHVLDPHGIAYEIVVVDDGSADETAAEAARAGARVLRHTSNRGYGAAIKTGILAAQYEAIIIIDADGTYPADQIPQLLARLDTADMVVGARTGRHVDIPWARKPAKWILTWLAARISGQSIPDVNSGLRAFRRDCIMQYFPILSNQFSFTLTSTLALLADDYVVAYHPIDYYRRVGESKITPRNFMDFVILVLRVSMMFQPLRIFVPLAVFCLLAGVLKVAWDISGLLVRYSTPGWQLIFQPVLSTSAILLLLIGLQLLLIGMVADAVVRRIALHSGPQVASHGVWLVETRPLTRICDDMQTAEHEPASGLAE
jgi:glycosyltransferase involved in cell wall biosynthesis